MTIRKVKSDKNDLDFMTLWLAENEMKIEFEKYKGKPKHELLGWVRGYRDSCQENVEVMEALQSIIKQEDWEVL